MTEDDGSQDHLKVFLRITAPWGRGLIAHAESAAQRVSRLGGLVAIELWEAGLGDVIVHNSRVYIIQDREFVLPPVTEKEA